MNIKKNLKWKLIYMRYRIYRYIISGYFKPYKVFSNLKLRRVSDLKEFYFGYYNISPENKAGDLLYCDLSHKDDGYIDAILNRNGKEVTIGRSKAFNLQQGCMLQWGYTNDKIAYYNVYNDSEQRYECVVYDTHTMREINRLSKPIYSISKQEDYALTLNFELLSKMRPDYGYFARTKYDILDSDKDGIWKIDLKTGKDKLIISLSQLADLQPTKTMVDARHKVNHIDISPDGSRFMFLHRWVGPMGRFMRLITADKNGKNIFVLNGDKMTSHCGWNPDSKRIVSFCNTEAFGDAYVEFVDRTAEKKLISRNLPLADGHPTFSPDGKWIVTDQYPELNRFSKLYLYNIEQDKCYTVGIFYQPLKYFRTSRIDLHSKWNMDGTRVYFESGHNGKRCLYFIEVKNN